MELCAVLAELDGVGVPLGYLLINKSIPSEMKTPKPGLEQRNQVPQIAETSAPGTMTEILSLFLEYLRSKGFDPSFVGRDKGLAEINALRQVWPSAKIQLCFWHAKRAIKKKLSDSSGANPLKQYRPNEALQLIPSLETCWGSYLSKRPNDNHRDGSCNCGSSHRSISYSLTEESSHREVICDAKERSTVLDMFSCHFNAHPLIPDEFGTRRSKESIHRKCAEMMYEWCKDRDYFKLWAYSQTLL
ncbi:hypothetical protein K3495_g15722 [Podosphaera aphanis]|nr:hypothetical protein K3495_g15722 [Podosphaera aphanis]